MEALSQQPPAAGAQGAAYTNRVPAEHALDSPATQSLRSRRRRSLPSSARTAALSVDSSSSTRAPKKRSANYIRTQAASPELISSLIDQLSAISASAQDHFEKLPVPATASPHLSRTTTTSGAGHHGSADDRSPYYSAIRDQNDLFPDDACEPPVVRTSKPPSGLSPMTAPPRTRKDKTHSLASYVGRSAGSSASIHSCHSNRSSTSFGNISIDAGPIAAKPVAAGAGGSNRSSAESKRSVKRPKSLMYMSSRERLKQKETDSRKRFDDTTSPDSPRKPASQLFSYEDTIKEEPVTREEHEPFVIAESLPLAIAESSPLAIAESSPLAIAESSPLAQRYPSRNPSPARRIRMNLVDGPHGESPIEQRLIPDRGSSLRHSSPTKRSKRRTSSKTNDNGKHAERPKTIAGTVPEDPPKTDMDPEEARKQKLLLELEQEENEVAQRIKQLREQKLLRDKIAGKLPAESPAGTRAVEVKPHVSGPPSPEASPTSIMPPTLERRGQNPKKAHKLLGISTLPVGHSSAESNSKKPLPSIEPREPTRPAPLPPHLRHSRHRSLTVNDGDDLPLPINYALALSSLDTSPPNSPQTPRADFTHMTLPSSPSFGVASTQSTGSSRDGLKRSNSLSVGGRSALGRKTNSMILTRSKGHKHSTSLTEERPPAFRSASEEVTPGRHSALSMASASNSFSLQQKKTLKKKRWSHPDLPAKAEKAHNDRVDAAEAAEARASHYAVNAWNPVIEERPTSLDSVDLDVDAYLHSPRLSQKIRHPQTGRIISFSEVGDPNGYAIFVCVGMGLTRFVMAFYDQLAATLKLRLITPERPGVGGSQVDPNGTPLTWPGTYHFFLLTLKMLTVGRRRTYHMSSSEDYQVLTVGSFGRRHLRSCNIVANATTYSRTGPPPRPLDTTVSDGTNRYWQRLTTHTATPTIPTIPPRPPPFASSSRKLYLPQQHKRIPPTHGTYESP